MSGENFDFKAISEQIYSNRAEHEKQIKEFLVKDEVCSVKEFFNCYKQEVSVVNSQITPEMGASSISDFKDLFNTFEKYPANIQKIKKPVPKDLNRTVLGPRAASCTDVTWCVGASLSPKNVSKWPEASVPMDVFVDYWKFKQELKTLLTELKQTDLENEYITKLEKLHDFAKEIEKLFASENRDMSEAFNKEQLESLRHLMVNLEKALYVDDNRYLFGDSLEQTGSKKMGQNLDSIIELLTYWLNSVAHYKE